MKQQPTTTTGRKKREHQDNNTITQQQQQQQQQKQLTPTIPALPSNHATNHCHHNTQPAIAIGNA